MKTKFVTCNYTDLYGTRFNGRLNREMIYMYSLRGIANCGDKIVCYTGPYDSERVTPFLNEHGVNNVEQIDFPLELSPYHLEVERIKNIKPIFYTEIGWLNRCVEIMWGKFLWLEDNMKDLEDDDYIFWIDAGLSHGGITPRRYNTFNGNPVYDEPLKPGELKLEYCHRHDLIYNNEFSKKLEEYCGEKIMLITNANQQHGDALGFDFHNITGEWPIGGLFGGKKKYMVNFINEFKRIADKVLAADCLVKEEQIMAVILNEHTDWFKTFKFVTWYHEDWQGCYDPNLKSFSDFFKEVLGV